MGHANMQMLFIRYARFVKNYEPEESKFQNLLQKCDNSVTPKGIKTINNS